MATTSKTPPSSGTKPQPQQHGSPIPQMSRRRTRFIPLGFTLRIPS